MSDPTTAFGEQESERVWLKPVALRNYWIAGGLALQFIGAAVPAGVLLHRAKSEDLLDHVDGLTVKLVWHQVVHHSGDLAMIILGAVLFVIGSMVLARPFVKSPVTLVIAVPLAALAFLVALGALALIVAVVALLVWLWLESPGGWNSNSTSSSSSSDRRKKRGQ